MSRKNGRHATPVPTQPPPNLGEGNLLTDEDARLLVQIVRATPDKFMMQIIHAMPVELLMQVIRETPVQGTLQSLPVMMARLAGLQEKLAGMQTSTTNEEGTNA